MLFTVHILCSYVQFVCVIDVFRFWEITSDTQSYHVVLLLASAWLSVFIQPCQVEFTWKFLKRMTLSSNALEHSVLRRTCSRTVLVCFLYLPMLLWTCDQLCCLCMKLIWSLWGSTSNQLWVESLWDYCQASRKALNTSWSKWCHCVSDIKFRRLSLSQQWRVV